MKSASPLPSPPPPPPLSAASARVQRELLDKDAAVARRKLIPGRSASISTPVPTSTPNLLSSSSLLIPLPVLRLRGRYDTVAAACDGTADVDEDRDGRRDDGRDDD
jgi:hypothetical protein